ncbi:hypothetical protein QCE73_00045 [Caballeronia sp. LZ029]|uniref:surface-adhesin E family protein n=1 Tax=Caballeronia sp. LZ029 TaxID=3038564 RepID=UPI002854D020|nr:surface-adhesin E family protein [Caballeronia sp. LZ029]MDR5741538.1 hypothetical protein [Caballeronia sp. LZ029]
MVKRILAALTGALICGHVVAAPNWIFYSKAPAQDWYVDANSIKSAGTNGYSLWMKYVMTGSDPKVAPGVSQVVIHAYGKCGAASLILDSIAAFDAAGNVVATQDTEQKVGMPPGSIYEGIASTACKVTQASK